MKLEKCYSKTLTYKHNRKPIQYFRTLIMTHKNGGLITGKATQHTHSHDLCINRAHNTTV